MSKSIGRVILGVSCAVFALMAKAAPIVLDNSISCNAGTAMNGISVLDVTGSLGGSNECWGTFNGNDPGPSGEGFSVNGTIFDFVAKDDADSGLSGADIGLFVEGNGTSSFGSWEFDSDLFAPTEFLIVLKAANSPGFAAWLFDGSAASSTDGSWSIAWINAGGRVPDLSHISIYATTVVPVPAAVWLFGSGLLGLVGIARRRG